MPHKFGFSPAAADTRLSRPKAASATSTIAANSRATRFEAAGTGGGSAATFAGSSSIGALGWRAMASSDLHDVRHDQRPFAERVVKVVAQRMHDLCTQDRALGAERSVDAVEPLGQLRARAPHEGRGAVA